MLFRLLRPWRERRERVERDAHDLLTFMGDAAYGEARSRARARQTERDAAGFRHWSRVATEIAWQTGICIGEKAADRYSADGSATEPKQHSPNRRAIIDGLVDISAGIADLTHGRGEATAQTLNARVWQLVELGPAPQSRETGTALRDAVEALAAESAENAASLASGIYPTRAEMACRALQRFKAALLPDRST